MVTASRSKWTAGKAVRAGLALGGRKSELICNRRITSAPVRDRRSTGQICACLSRAGLPRTSIGDLTQAMELALGSLYKACKEFENRDLDRAGPLVVRENQSRRDLTKVAQYEVLGNEAKDGAVPLALGTIEMLGFWSSTRLSNCQHSSIVPFLLRRPDYGGQAGTDCSLKTLTQPRKRSGLGYFH
jgi:hypothetical protein